ncbi:cytochrome P450 4C1-like isoform X1 [Vespula squamosa]|uniref:Cytochrome P450 4C1-like isoform X1 n=1 Tax=Vespula squamosa TaxID=30214 RepID=A0ABD1ZYE8_VESSQ
MDNITRNMTYPFVFMFEEPKPCSFLDVLFESSHEEGKYSEQDIRDEINTIVIANEVYEELNKIYGSSDPKHVPIVHNDIKNMKLLERVIKETLRLFPVAPLIARKVTQDIEESVHYLIKNWTIPKGRSAVFFICNLHRNENYWPQPLVFDPDRFLPGRNSSSNFFPFSYGRRNCIGQKFAMLEMTVIIATLLRRFIIKIDKPKEIGEIGVKLSISLKPIELIKLKFEKDLHT